MLQPIAEWKYNRHELVNMLPLPLPPLQGGRILSKFLLRVKARQVLRCKQTQDPECMLVPSANQE